MVSARRTGSAPASVWLAVTLSALITVGLPGPTQPAAAAPADAGGATSMPTTTRAVAVDLDALRAGADLIEAQMARLDRRLERLIEDYDRARERQDGAAARLALARLDMARAAGELQVHQALLQRRLRDMYKMGNYSLLDVVATTSSLDDARARLRFFRLIGRQDADAARERARLVERVRALTLQIQAERDRAARLTHSVKESERSVQARLAERTALLAGLDARIEREMRRRRDVVRRQAERLARQAGVDLSSVRATAEQLAVVRETMRYLGVPYRYGGGAPHTGFDCSGLVMYAYAKFGVNLPHFAAWQEEQGTPVPFDKLQPADLVFFGSPIHHVGMYVGNGRFIHAPHTGDVVRIALLAERTDLTAAGRYHPRLPPD